MGYIDLCVFYVLNKDYWYASNHRLVYSLRTYVSNICVRTNRSYRMTHLEIKIIEKRSSQTPYVKQVDGEC
ncbi:MAG: hypothetical protein ACUZ8E_12610, partial [Candidatus Anammoxibacter sp.]